MQRGRYNQGGEYQSLYLYGQGENTKVGGEKYVWEKICLFHLTTHVRLFSPYPIPISTC